VQIAHRGLDIAVPQEALEGDHVRAAFDQMGGERMALMPISA